MLTSEASAKMSKPTGTMQETIIGRLPGELRNMIYKLVLDADFQGESRYDKGYRRGLHVVSHTRSDDKPLHLRNLLAVFQVCSQMRTEAMPFLFQSKAIWLVHRNLTEIVAPMAVPTKQELKDWSDMMRQIPMHLRSPRMTIEYRHSSELPVDPLLLQEPPSGGSEFNTGINALIKAAAPNEVVVVVNFNFTSIGTFRMDDDYFNAGIPDPKPFHVCGRDEPMTVGECKSILIKILTSSAKKACQVVRHAFAEKRERLEKHRSHRVCFIRLGLKTSLERLAIVEKKTQELMEHLPAWRPGHTILDQ